MDRFTFQFNGKTYVDNSPRSTLEDTTLALVAIEPDAVHEPSFNVAVINDGDTTMEAKTETSKPKKQVAKTKAKRGASTSTKFSEYCKANKVDGVKARRALRAAGMRAPYDPASKKVIDVLATL